MFFTVASRILEVLFGVGVIGCVVVFLLTTVEDIRMLFNWEEKQ
jgi:hypothetical protein